MKFILVLTVVVVVLWLARRALRRVSDRDPAAPPAPALEEMVACRQCGLNLPRSDSLPGRGGVFCSQAHRAAFEQDSQG